MNRKKLLINSLIFFIPFIIDRLTKHLALSGFFSKYKFPFVTLDILINRGISLGFFDSESKFVFLMLSIVILFILVILLFHIKTRISTGTVAGEILVLSGAISNYIDRILHNGVIDFIILPIGKSSWPGVFNFADVFILFGILIILTTNK